MIKRQATDWMKDKSGLDGLSVERKFEKWCIERGNRIYDPPTQMNIEDHIDFIIYNKKDERYTADIKAQKRISRGGNKQSSWTWVEFSNVNGKPGWLFGKADYIIFEMGDGWIFVKLDKLRDLCKRLVDVGTIVKSPSEAKYKIYQRENRKDKISLIEISEIKNIGNYLI
tara:strand:- start:124 stop:633 length:510 start_codon:yes stop_codon:yes gene_type:complete